MPRISTKLINEAFRINPLLPLLLPECRTITNSRQEYIWIRDELSLTSKSPYDLYRKLRAACKQRFHHIPLQYILKTQPFGSLEIHCARNVLIPRWETEEWVIRLIKCLKSSEFDKLKKKNLKILDVCTGSGCVALLLKYELSKIFKKSQENDNVDVKAFDISPYALALAKKNRSLAAINETIDIDIEECDIMHPELQLSDLYSEKIDILTCNPPYIPNSQFTKDVSRSVKLFEPKLALLGDKEFYTNLIEKWLHHINSFVYEVGDVDQANYVKNSITNEPNLRNEWKIGQITDSNDKIRVVYGYRSNGSDTQYDMDSLFKNFGSIIYDPGNI